MLKISYWDLRIGDFVKVTGQARNTYEVLDKSEQKINLRRIRDGLQHHMQTSRFLDIINGRPELNDHLVGRDN